MHEPISTEVWNNAKVILPFKDLPNGDYIVQTLQSEVKPAKTTGTPLWSIQVMVVTGEYAGQKVYINIPLVDKQYTADRIKTAFAAYKYTGAFDILLGENVHYFEGAYTGLHVSRYIPSSGANAGVQQTSYLHTSLTDEERFTLLTQNRITAPTPAPAPIQESAPAPAPIQESAPAPAPLPWELHTI